MISRSWIQLPHPPFAIIEPRTRLTRECATHRTWLPRPRYALRIRRGGPTVEHPPRPPDQRRSGSYSIPFASAWRKRGAIVEFAGLHIGSAIASHDRDKLSVRPARR